MATEDILELNKKLQLQIKKVEEEKQKLFIKMSKEIEDLKRSYKKLQEQNTELISCVKLYAAGDIQANDCEYVDVQGKLTFKTGAFARQYVKKLGL